MAATSETIYALEEISRQAEGHKRSTAYNDGVNIALENIEKNRQVRPRSSARTAAGGREAAGYVHEQC